VEWERKLRGTPVFDLGFWE